MNPGGGRSSPRPGMPAGRAAGPKGLPVPEGGPLLLAALLRPGSGVAPLLPATVVTPANGAGDGGRLPDPARLTGAEPGAGVVAAAGRCRAAAAGRAGAPKGSAAGTCVAGR